MTARKPCFECNDNERDDMSIGECLESPLCTSKDENGCSHINSGKHWEDCGFGARSDGYPAFLAKQDHVQCPCCKGSGFVEKKESIVDEIRALEWVEECGTAWCTFCGESVEHGHTDDCKLAAILRRLK